MTMHSSHCGGLGRRRKHGDEGGWGERLTKGGRREGEQRRGEGEVGQKRVGAGRQDKENGRGGGAGWGRGQGFDHDD